MFGKLYISRKYHSWNREIFKERIPYDFRSNVDSEFEVLKISHYKQIESFQNFINGVVGKVSDDMEIRGCNKRYNR